MLAHRLVTSTLLLTALTARLAAQDLAPDVVQRIGAASKIRVTLLGGVQRTMHRPAVDSGGLEYPGSLVIHGGPLHADPDPDPMVPMTQVTRIQVPSGSHAGRGATIGGAVGLGLSILAIAITSSDPWLTPTAGEAVGAMVSWTAIGAGVGAVIGCTSPRWTTVYASP